MPKFFTGKREVYLEVADRYEKYIRLGVLTNGDKLPSVRVVAEDMGVNPNTVQKAYCHLEQLGLVVTLPKKGVYVSLNESSASTTLSAYNTLSALRESGLSRQEVMNLLSEVYDNDQN